MEKTKAFGSAVERTEIHVPFYTEYGFSELRIQEKIPEVITGTEEEKEKIREMLKEDKGAEEDKKIKEQFKGQTIDVIIQDDVMPEPIIHKVVLEDDNGNKKTIIDNTKPKKKRGRPAKKGKK